MDIEIIGIRQRPEYAGAAIDYFASKWSVPRETYAESIGEGMATAAALPRWHLMLDGGAVIGSYGLIQNDFINRTDLFPWLCALYVEAPYRGKGLGGRLLAHGKAQAAQLGFPMLYLATDHIGYYERYGFTYLAQGTHDDGDTSRIYQAKTGE